MPRTPPISRGPSIDELSQQIKDRLDIPTLAAQLFPGWEPKKSCCSPFRDDRKPSFSVFGDGQEFKDHATGERGDVFDFYVAAKGCDSKEAFRALKEMALGVSVPTPIIRAPAAFPKEEKQRVHPELRTPTAEELRTISEVRAIAVSPLQMAVERGLLHVATSARYNCECLVVTDGTRRNYRARRLDGQKVGASKVVPIEGVEQSWPIGIKEAQAFPCIALCEGEMDFLAAFDRMQACGTESLVAPVCMAGSKSSIPKDVIPLFTGKRVRIFMHADRPGEEARDHWVEQIFNVAKTIDSFEFAGYYQLDESVVTDLNDLLKINPSCFEQHREEIENIMKF